MELGYDLNIRYWGFEVAAGQLILDFAGDFYFHDIVQVGVISDFFSTNQSL